MADFKHSHDSFVFKTDRPWPNPRLKVGAVVGHTTATTARMWVRAGRLGEFVFVTYPWEDALRAFGSEEALSAFLSSVPFSFDETSSLTVSSRVAFTIPDYSADTTHVVELDEMEPRTSYGYFLYDGAEERVILGHNRLRRFRTLGSEGEQRAFQFALFSCHMPYEVNGLFTKRTEVANVAMWDFLGATLERHRGAVDFVIAGGDQCYTDGVETLDIWQHLNRTMRKENGLLLPDEEALLSWYRDVYRGYWGFENVQKIFENFPTYMIWDDHEIGDGWGSHYLEADYEQNGMKQMLPDLAERGLSYADGLELTSRMFKVAKQVYFEYQHSHNPPTEDEVFDYAFSHHGAAFYVLDGRGQRDIERDAYRILGREQFERFERWASSLTPEATPFAFVVSAVPVLHTRAALVAADELLGSLGDDLRDSWEHELHDVERRRLMDVLFELAKKGINVAVLSGDVHVSALFAINDADNHRIYQITSSAITYGLTRPQSWILRAGAADDGVTAEGHHFERLALYAQSTYALIEVDPGTGEAWFKIYGEQKLEALDRTADAAVPLTHSLAKIRLF